MKWDALQLILVVRIYKSYYLLNREKQGGLQIVVFQNTGMNPDVFIHLKIQNKKKVPEVSQL